MHETALTRRTSRKRVLMTATIISQAGIQQARIRDWSTSGVQISCDRPPTTDTDVIFKRGQVFVAARVAWMCKGDAGLEFYRQIDPIILGQVPSAPSSVPTGVMSRIGEPVGLGTGTKA